VDGFGAVIKRAKSPAIKSAKIARKIRLKCDFGNLAKVKIDTIKVYRISCLYSMHDVWIT
ncbi:MAG: hypothetical protein AAB890_00005, partial [Patescibacteria group bacterium]